MITEMLALLLTWSPNDTPQVHELERFPSRVVVNRTLIFQRGLRESLRLHQLAESWHCWDYQAATDELSSSYLAWDALSDAYAVDGHPEKCWKQLAKLKQLLGDDAWYHGRMPPVFPQWIMREIE